MQRQSLEGTWQVRHEALAVIGAHGLAVVGAKETGWIPATVPGEVHLDLMAAGQMEEPLFSTNAPRCRWVEDRSWWYRLRFTPDPAVRAETVQELVFEGLDCYAQVFLNGVLLGEVENAFVSAAFEVHHHLTDGENDLVVRLTAGTERAGDQRMGESTPANLHGNRQTFKGISDLRKPQFSYGWDWVDSLPNIGIWRGVSLRGDSRVRIHDLRHGCDLEGGRCRLRVVLDTRNLHPSAEWQGTARLRLRDPAGVLVAEAAAPRFFPVGIDRWQTVLEVPTPQVWWPAGLGDQPLYDLEAVVEADGAERDRWTRRIGLRTVALDRSPQGDGHRFCLKINGEDVFCRGGNWIPADAILARVDRARTERLVDEAVEAGFTMLRVWGGGVYESDDFYAACDRRGILVWQDFLFACTTYPDDRQAFRDIIRNEAAAAIRRLRHHPSLVLWCGNNENLWMFAQWNSNWQYTFPDPRMQIGGRHLYGRVLPEVCLDLDPERPYWPGSPAGGRLPDCETEGDVHWWGQATMSKDMERRIRHEVYDQCRGRFVSEYGVIGPCHLASLRQSLRPEEIDTAHRAWRIHTNAFEKETTPAAIRRHYADPEGLPIERYIRYGQMFQALLYGRSIEALRFRKHDPVDDCAGALIWMFNDCWCETGWTPIDYFLRRKASWYWIRRACLPVRAIVRRRGDDLVVRVVNDTRAAREVAVHLGWLRVDGADRAMQRRTVRVPANGMVEVDRLPVPADADRPHDQWIFATWAEGEGVETVPCTWLLRPHRELATVDPGIRLHVDGRRITLTAQAYAHGVGHDDQGERVFSDNWFDLLPGLPATITCHGPVPERLEFTPT